MHAAEAGVEEGAAGDGPGLQVQLQLQVAATDHSSLDGSLLP